MLDTLISEIADRKAQRQRHLQPPCPPDRLDGLRKNCLADLKSPLPEGYAELLRRTDGIDWNGTVFYASATAPIVGYSDRLIEGFIEANLNRRSGGECEHLLIFGESGMEMYAFSMDTQHFHVLDQLSLDQLEEYASFEQLFTAAYEKRLWPKGRPAS